MPSHSALFDQQDSHGLVVRVPDSASSAADNEKNDDSSKNATVQQPRDDVEFKEGGYGWVVVGCVFLTNAHTWGLNSSYAVFLAYYLHSGAFPGASPIELAFVGGLSFSVALLSSPIVTFCIPRIGTQASLGIGVVVQAAALIGASFTTKIWHLLLSQGIGFGVGMGFTFNSTVGLVSQWFVVRRSFANSIATAGSGFGGLIYSLGTNAMIRNISLPWAFRILAILSFVVNGLCCLVVKDRNKALGSVHIPFHKDIFKRGEFWLCVSWGFFGLFGYVISVFSLADYAQTVGFSASQGSIVSAIFNLSQGIGRPIIGLVSDRFGRINVAGLSTLIAGLATFFIWIFAGKYLVGIIFFALFGAFSGVLWTTVAPVATEVVGIQLLPSAMSIFWMVLVIPATFAEPIGLTIKTSSIDAYLNVQVFTGFMYIAAFLSIWFLRVWKIRQLEKIALSGEQEEYVLHDNNAVSLTTSRRTGPKLSIIKSVWKGMLNVQRV
ncbi:major facilitator superfamily transporter [Colletotrichum graminicola]|uniref:Major facilitator superfamily transporter n=1 Tax=Colletotrichum graminicola (strain M1.001 / M2 / FGSC 10212) TaxID=645133 RepID=E3QUW0_COLGM|nr:major facilitator superfamily transporter [Colletotrichum graminicola M1.001]EFQ34648.1 major facilitator superfamily transporter [Colletotrichum graminicola M1.001]WDK22797.1 major facilitator superfamily transporter [Colletotrichum graminicola]